MDFTCFFVFFPPWKLVGSTLHWDLKEFKIYLSVFDHSLTSTSYHILLGEDLSCLVGNTPQREQKFRKEYLRTRLLLNNAVFFLVTCKSGWRGWARWEIQNLIFQQNCFPAVFAPPDSSKTYWDTFLSCMCVHGTCPSVAYIKAKLTVLEKLY